MWAFASRQFRRWLIVAVGVPVAAWALDRLGEELEARRGETTLSQAVRTTGAALHRRERGPFAGRRTGGAGRPDHGGGLAEGGGRGGGAGRPDHGGGLAEGGGQGGGAGRPEGGGGLAARDTRWGNRRGDPGPVR